MARASLQYYYIMGIVSRILIIIFLVYFAGCLKKTPKHVVTMKSGLKYTDLKTGKGKTAKPGSRLVVHYTGWFLDGKKFDSSKDRRMPFKFVLGKGEVVKGWEEGIIGMKEGGKRKLMVPPELGYGEKGVGDFIPPDTPLIFEIELLKVGKK